MNMNPPKKIWLVVQPSGEKHLLTQEPLGGLAAWARGLDATIAEYELKQIVHHPPPPPPPKK